MKLFKFLSIAVFVFGFAVLSFAADHVIVTESKYDFKTTVAKVKTCIKNNKQATLFNEIDHQANAKKAGAEMGKATLFIFGNPAAGSKFMAAYPQAAIDLPLKVLVFEDKDKVYISYVNPADIASNYKGAANHPFIKGVSGMLAKMVENVNK